MPSEAQSQGHSGVNQRPTGEPAPQQKGRFHRYRPSARLDSSPFPPNSTHSGGEWTHTTKGTTSINVWEVLS